MFLRDYRQLCVGMIRGVSLEFLSMNSEYLESSSAV